jgi:hypothetical protein
MRVVKPSVALIHATPDLERVIEHQVEEDLTKAAKDVGEETPPPAVRAILLCVGDIIRANGYLYRVRKVTPKDIVIRPLGAEKVPHVVVPHG